MPKKDRQKLITEIVSTVLGEKAETDRKFDWFINKHKKQHFKGHFYTIDHIFKTLKGNIESNQSKRLTYLECDAYFGGKYNFIFEFDEYQHFSSARLQAIDLYPKNLRTNFLFTTWEKFCGLNKEKADKYRQNKKTKDFNFVGSRTAQRAYLDCFRDLLPSNHGLNPTLRIADFEVKDIYSNTTESCRKVEGILKIRIKEKMQ
jgi:hypothetical protein